MRQGSVVYYLHGDHLGSTSLTTDQSGALVSQARYLPYGEERWTNGASPTDFAFTSQRPIPSPNFLWYKRRFTKYLLVILLQLHIILGFVLPMLPEVGLLLKLAHLAKPSKVNFLIKLVNFHQIFNDFMFSTKYCWRRYCFSIVIYLVYSCKYHISTGQLSRFCILEGWSDFVLYISWIICILNLSFKEKISGLPRLSQSES